MKLVKASYEILEPNLDWRGDCSKPSDVIYKQIERAGRTCYKSEDKITNESAEKFVRSCVKRGHEAMLEHASMTVKFICDRGISHEIVRHRIASYAQESTRYCNYSQDKFGNEITVIEPSFFFDIPEGRRAAIRDYLDVIIKCIDISELNDHERAYGIWYFSCKRVETDYFDLLNCGLTAQEARDILPTSLKTEIIVTMNMREWRHFLKLRAAGTTGKPHPQMQEIAVPLLKELREKLPALFDDIPLPEENAV